MQTGFLLPTFVFGNGIVTSIPWSNPNNILLVDGDVAVSNSGQGVASDFTVGGFSASLPTDAVVDGIEIKVIGFQGLQTVPTLSLTLNAYDNNAGADTYYPYTAPFTGLGPVIGEYVLGSPTYLFGTTWSIDQINNFKLNLTANGDISLDCVLINVYYHLTTPPVPPTPTPGVCIDCSSPIQVQAMALELPFLSGQTKFYLKKGSFVYPNGVPVQPGDIGSCGGVIPLVFDEGKPKIAGGNFEENAQIDLANSSWTVLTSGVIEVDIGTVNNRGLDYKTPGTHVATNMSDHDANSKVIISNNTPWNLQLVRRCQVDSVFAPPIAVYDEGILLTLSAHSFNFVGSVVTATMPTAHNILVTINAQGPLQFQDEGINLGTAGTADTVNFIGSGVVATRVGNTINVTISGGGGGGGHIIEQDGTPFPNEAALNFINFFILTDTAGFSTNVDLDVVAIANNTTFITALTTNSTFISNIISIAASGGAPKIDQTPSDGTYGLLAGAVNGSNTTFTVSTGVYLTGTLLVYLNGLLQLQGAADDWSETDPATGVFDFVLAPLTGDIITVVYQTTGSSPSGAPFTISQTAHGFGVGDIIRPDVNQWIASQSDTPAHAEAWAQVTVVIDANNFTATPLVGVRQQQSNIVALLSTFAGGDPLYVDPTTPGAFTNVAPVAVGQVTKPIGYVEADAGGTPISLLTVNYRGQENLVTPTASVDFNAPISRSKNTNYQAATAGILVAFTTNDPGAGCEFEILSDSSATPATRVALYKPASSGEFGTLTFPVKSGDYYNVHEVANTATFTINFIPFA